MFRKLLAIVVLGGLLYVAFHFSRNVRHDEELVATIIFDSAPGVRRGTPLIESGKMIGEVTKVGKVADKAAVTVAIPAEHRGRIYSDSAFSLDGDPPAIRVLSSISVGSPLQNGAVVVAREDRLAKLITKGGEKLAPHIAAARDKALDVIGEYDTEMFRRQLDEWAEDVPEWKAQGKDVLKDNVADLEHTVGEIEDALRKIKRDAEADKIRDAFDRWVEDLDK